MHNAINFYGGFEWGGEERRWAAELETFRFKRDK
jgi:hypothetical protein